MYLVALVLNSYGAFAMNIQYVLPSAEIIRTRLYDKGLEHFVTISCIDKALGNQAKRPIETVIAVDSAIQEYSSKEPYEITSADMISRRFSSYRAPTRNVITREILKDHPRAIQHLELNHFLK